MIFSLFGWWTNSVLACKYLDVSFYLQWYKMFCHKLYESTLLLLHFIWTTLVIFSKWKCFIMQGKQIGVYIFLVCFVLVTKYIYTHVPKKYISRNS